MRVWRTIRLVAGGGMVVVLGAAAMMLWPLLWPPDPDASVQLVNGRLIGETSGYVGRVDRTAQTVDISSSLVGWRPIVVVVNDQTAIMVQSRQGGFGDLLKDLPVRVSYEVVGDRRLAKSIEVVTEDGERSRAPASGKNGSVTPGLTSPSAVPALSPAGAVPPPAVRPSADVPAPRAVDVTPPRDAVPAPPAKAPVAPALPPPAAPPAVRPPTDAPAPRAVDVTPPRAAVPAPPTRAPVAPALPPPAAKPLAPVVREPVAPVVPPPAVKPPAPVVRETAPRVEPAVPRASAPVAVEPRRIEPSVPRVSPPRVDTEAPSSARPARPAGPDTEDGAAAIDWLFKRGR